MSDGSGEGERAQVDEELCSGLELAVDGDKQIVLKEACTLPCPGEPPSSIKESYRVPLSGLPGSPCTT